MQNRVNISILNAYYGNMLSDSQKEIIRLYHDCDMSLAEVSIELGMTRQGVRESLLRSAKKLEQWETQLKFAQRLGDLSAKVEALINRMPKESQYRAELGQVLTDIKEI